MSKRYLINILALMILSILSSSLYAGSADFNKKKSTVELPKQEVVTEIKKAETLKEAPAQVPSGVNIEPSPAIPSKKKKVIQKELKETEESREKKSQQRKTVSAAEPVIVRQSIENLESKAEGEEAVKVVLEGKYLNRLTVPKKVRGTGISVKILRQRPVEMQLKLSGKKGELSRGDVKLEFASSAGLKEILLSRKEIKDAMAGATAVRTHRLKEFKESDKFKEEVIGGQGRTDVAKSPGLERGMKEHLETQRVLDNAQPLRDEADSVKAPALQATAGQEQIMKRLRADAEKFNRFMADVQGTSNVASDPSRTKYAAQKLERHGASVISQGLVAKLILAGLAEAGPLEKAIQREFAKTKPEEVIKRLEKDRFYAKSLPGASAVQKAVSAELSRIERTLRNTASQVARMNNLSKPTEYAQGYTKEYPWSRVYKNLAYIVNAVTILVAVVKAVMLYGNQGNLVGSALVVAANLTGGTVADDITPCVESARNNYKRCLLGTGKKLEVIPSCTAIYQKKLAQCPSH